MWIYQRDYKGSHYKMSQIILGQDLFYFLFSDFLTHLGINHLLPLSGIKMSSRTNPEKYELHFTE